MSAQQRGLGAQVSGRLQLALAVLVLSCLQVLLAGSAQAVLTVDLEWVSTTGSGTPGSNVIEARPGDLLVLEIRITVDAAGVDGYSLSVAFDEDGLDELDLVSTVEFEHVASLDCEPFPECFDDFGPELMNLNEGIESEIDSSPNEGGLAEAFEAVNDATGPAQITIPIGEITFLVTGNVAADGDDLESVMTAFDGYLDNEGNFIGESNLPDPAFVPGYASVPEPRAVLLGLTALATLAVLRRSCRLLPRRVDPRGSLGSTS